jgi:type II secretion system protein H
MQSHGAFTLIELILVMVMLAVVMSLVFPSLKGFFRARNLDSEAQRFLALTHAAQSRAVSQGVPMILWMNPQANTYGLEVQAGYGVNETKPQQFQLDESLQLQPQSAVAGLITQSNLWTEARRTTRPEIRFLPDGTISESSPNRILLKQDKDDAVWITETTNHLRYEITRQ